VIASPCAVLWLEKPLLASFMAVVLFVCAYDRDELSPLTRPLDLVRAQERLKVRDEAGTQEKSASPEMEIAGLADRVTVLGRPTESAARERLEGSPGHLAGDCRAASVATVGVRSSRSGTVAFADGERHGTAYVRNRYVRDR
jgi:hypothetical protein